MIDTAIKRRIFILLLLSLCLQGIAAAAIKAEEVEVDETFNQNPKEKLDEKEGMCGGLLLFFRYELFPYEILQSFLAETCLVRCLFLYLNMYARGW